MISLCLCEDASVPGCVSSRGFLHALVAFSPAKKKPHPNYPWRDVNVVVDSRWRDGWIISVCELNNSFVF